ncbi:transposase [Vibrio metschnikovii]|nr:transposase [Vibrio metschnikovii]EKO3768775.1 transposase [Vibrio metschnikovii]
MHKCYGNVKAHNSKRCKSFQHSDAEIESALMMKRSFSMSLRVLRGLYQLDIQNIGCSA